MSAIRKKPQLIKCGNIEYILGKLNRKFVVSIFTSNRAFQKSFSNNFTRNNWISEHIPYEIESVIELNQSEQEKYESKLKRM